MPRLSVWMIRAALLHLGVGFTLGALMLWNKGMPFDDRIWLLLPAHLELVLLGWTLQLAFGAAFWILPRFSARPQPYGDARWGWLSFALINAGVIAAALATWIDGLLLIGRLLQLLAALSFALLMWPRIKPLSISPSSS